jgi:hypothetical protein
MKKLSFLFALMVITLTIFSQTITTEVVEISKQQVPAFTMTMPYQDAKILTEAITDCFTKGGLKSSKTSGYVSFLNQNFKEFGLANYDIFAKVIKTGKKANTALKYYLIVTKGNMNAVTEANDPELAANIKQFMNNFIPFAEGYFLKSDMENMKNDLAKQEKAMKKLQKEQADLNKKMEVQQKVIIDLQAKIQKANEALNSLPK